VIGIVGQGGAERGLGFLIRLALLEQRAALERHAGVSGKLVGRFRQRLIGLGAAAGVLEHLREGELRGEVVRMRGHGVAQDDDRAVLAAGLAERASLELREARIVGTPQSRRTRNVGRLVVLLGEQIRLDERRLEARLPLRDRPRALERARRRLPAAGLQLREPEVRQQRQQIAAGCAPGASARATAGRQGVGGLVVERWSSYTCASANGPLDPSGSSAMSFFAAASAAA
jgi:hypothetical protein